MSRIFSNLSIIAKLGLSLGLIVLVAIALNIWSTVEADRVGDANAEVDRLRTMSDDLQALNRGLEAQRSALLYLLVTADRSVLPQYDRGVEQFDAAYKRFREGLDSDTGMQRETDNLETLRTKAMEWRTSYAEKQLQQARNYKTLNLAKAVEVSGEPGDLFAEIEKLSAALNAGMNEKAQAATFNAGMALERLNLVKMISLGSTLVISGLVIWMMLHFVAKPIRAMTRAMTDIAKGALNTNVPSTDSADEVGDMARAVEVFKSNAIERQRLEAEAEEQRSLEARREREEREREERERQLEAERQAEILRRREEKEARIVSLITEYDSSAQGDFARVTQIVDLLNEVSNTMSSAAVTTQEQANNVARAAVSSSENVQSVASVTEEMDSSVQEIAQQIDRTSRRTADAAELVSRTRTDMRALEDSAVAIGNVMKLISDIAEQTNLLALNATIEAARAGDAGRGFAVVAGEVKNLASQTGNATNEIRAQIEAVQDQTKSVAEAISNIEAVTREITDMAAAIASAVEEQRAATNEIARSVSHAASNTSEVSTSITSVAEAAESNSQVAVRVASSSQELKVTSDQIRTVTQRFIETIKHEALAS
ncbi:methyl-accepting chemotaxis protein [Pseudokordiimonas caeni]|uniref:methyl-accepting chemotaxis protein n=1 Tax=Pseudokordiimonas caeni TaxID=2997908 RepID=UPI002811D1A5|nr:HAMP domain-containing methyl-accepting chemotaxis protein [Pseudokordiimonas caeni]